MSSLRVSNRRIAFALRKPHIYFLNNAWQVKQANFGYIPEFTRLNLAALNFRHILNTEIYK